MKVAIHHREGSFSDRWINYCDENKIPYVIVNCHDNSIIELLIKEKATHLLWHFSHGLFKDIFIFNNVLNAIDSIGIKTFPNFNTRWSFDDKIAQKYQLESINAPIVDSYVFYDKRDSTIFLSKCSYPIIGKLRRGAGAVNVNMLKDENEALSFSDKMFGIGFSPLSAATDNLDQKLRLAKQIRNPFKLIKKVKNFLKKNKENKNLFPNERGYAYFQQFLPNNNFDTRIIVIGDIAFGIVRYNRDNDFRASGSGKLSLLAKDIDLEMVKIAFEVSEKLETQCVAYDFVYDGKSPKIIETSFGFSMKAYDDVEGYWDKNLKFHQGKFNPQYFMIENLLNE